MDNLYSQQEASQIDENKAVEQNLDHDLIQAKVYLFNDDS